MRKRLLIAEDDSNIALLYKAIFLNKYDVKVLNNGRDALIALDDFKPHIVISDLAMPLMDGYAFVQAITNTPSDFIVVVISSSIDRNRRELAYIDYAITKPFDPTALETLVCDLLLALEITSPDELQKALAFYDHLCINKGAEVLKERILTTITHYVENNLLCDDEA